MRPDHPELLTTLRDVAATAVTLLDAFAQIRRERTAPPATSSAPPQADPDDPTAAPVTQVDLDDAPDASPTAAADPPDTDPPIFFHRTSERTPMEAVYQRLVGTSHRTGARENAILQQWAFARELTNSINDRLFEIAELAHNAIQEDGLRTLPILDALIERIHDEFRDRTGPFAAVPDIGLVR